MQSLILPLRAAGNPRWLWAALFIGLLAGCATPPQTRQLGESPPPALAAGKQLANVPFFPQQAYQCGPASLAMVLRHTQVDVVPDQLVSQVYVPGREGAFQVEMMAATRQYDRLALESDPSLANLLAWIDAGVPVLVLQNLGLEWYPKWHYAVAIGYDLEAMEITLHSGEIAGYTIPMSLFERTWQRSDYWGMTALPPGELPVKVAPLSYLKAAAALEDTNPDAGMEKVWRTGADTWPGEPAMLMGLANHYYGAGDWNKARAAYRQVIGRHPGYLPAYNNLATLLTEQGEAEEAVAIASEGLEKAGGSHAFLERTLAEARKRLEDTANNGDSRSACSRRIPALPGKGLRTAR